MRFDQEAVMKSNHGGKDSVRMELKYCEHCGGLWVREGGAGVYCEKCRAKVTSYTVVTFEDRVIFVHDMEKCLDKLDEFSRQLIARHILQEHDQAATGKLLNCTERTVRTYVPITLDLLSDILLEVGLLEPQDTNTRNSCQGGKRGEIFVSNCEQGKNNF